MNGRAMVLEQFRAPLVQKTFPFPRLAEGEVLVKITAAGVCGSDVHMWEGKDPRVKLPMILGHEGVGEIVDIKGKVTDLFSKPLNVGDTILWNRGVSCGRCYFCQIVREPSLCSNRWVYGIHTTSAEPPYLTGNYSEYLLLAAGTTLFSIETPVDHAVLVSASCSGATVAHAFETFPVKPGDTVLVQGPGPLGIFSVAFAKAQGASKIIVIGGSKNRLELCEAFGATHLLNRKKTTLPERLETLLELTRGLGVDVAYEMAGEPEAIEEGIPLVRTGGGYVTAGFGEPRGQVTLNWFQAIARRNIHLHGIWVSDSRHTWMALQLMLHNPSLFEKMVTHRFPLEEANAALKSMATREALKAVLIPHHR
jgi:threonine dehydrogenase-like Zn-dependent dehydrogenase